MYPWERQLRLLYDNKGVLHLHLFAALPAALAVMIDHLLGSSGEDIMGLAVKYPTSERRGLADGVSSARLLQAWT